MGSWRGDHGELYVTKGAVVGDDDPDASWSLVGQSETVTFNIPGVDATGWTIETSEPGGEEITTLEAGIADLDAGVTTVEALMSSISTILKLVVQVPFRGIRRSVAILR